MHLNNFAGIKEPPSHKLALQIVSQAFSMSMHTFFTVVGSVCTHSLVVLLRLTHNFSFQYRSCSHPFKCLYILITWLTSLLPIIRYLSYIQVFTLINSAAMNVFVKKLPFLWILPPGISPKRDCEVKEHEVLYNSYFIARLLSRKIQSLGCKDRKGQPPQSPLNA